MAGNADLAAAELAAFVGGSLELVDKMTVEAVNKNAMNRGGEKSNRLDIRKFLPQNKQRQIPQQFQPPQYNNLDGNEVEINNQISVVPVPDDLKDLAKKYMVPQAQVAPQQMVMGNIQTQPQSGGINTLAIILAMDKKLDTIVEKLELICKTAKIVRK